MILKTGDIIFRHSHTFVGKIIQKVIDKPYNHVDIAYIEGTEHYMVGAVGRGVMLRPINELKGLNILVRRSIEDINEQRMKIELLNLCDRKYDFVGLVTELSWNLAGIWTGAKTEEKAMRRLFCYELYWFMYKHWWKTEWWKQFPAETIYTNKTITVYKGIWE